ncbi:MAG: adenylate cyclase regulatory domain-containing protein [Acidimicrobiales bacterium]|jgi:adenylate cyclase
MNAEGWELVGLYDPSATGADERWALLEYLTARGATLEQMVQAHRLGMLPAVAGDLVLERESSTLSVDEVADRCAVAVERVQRLLLALGLPVATDSKLPKDFETLMASFEQGAILMGEDAILAFTRVLGAAATTIAEAAVALFYAELGPGTGREGPDEVARARVSERATLAFATVPEVLSAALVAQFDRAVRRAVLTRGWASPTEMQDEAGAVGRETTALGFVDLVGSTAWAEGLSLRDHSVALSRFESAAWSSAVLAGGRVVKMIGDEVFFAAPSADAACRIGTKVCRAAMEDPLLPPARGAVGYGMVTAREGDYFGPLVNLVSRLVRVASPGAIVATQEAAEALSADNWTLRELDPQSIMGLGSPVRVFAVRGADSQPR